MLLMTERPNAIESLTTSLYSTSPLHLSRVLLMLLYVVKELSTAKLQRSRAGLQSAAPGIVQALSTVYIGRLNKWMTFLKDKSDDEGGALESVELSLLSLRVLRRLLITGFEFPNRHQELQALWKTLNVQFGEMVTMIQGYQLTINDDQRLLIEKHLVQISKLHFDMVKTHPSGYVLLPESIGIAQGYWLLIRQCGEMYGSQGPDSSALQIGANGDADDETPILERLSLKGLLILRACGKMVFNPAQTFKYQNSLDKEEKQLSRQIIKQDLLSDAFAREVMETLVTRFFVFTTRDLKEWEEEPDEWERTQEGEGEDWEFSIRTCSEKLFLDLMINYKNLLLQPLLGVFGTVSGK